MDHARSSTPSPVSATTNRVAVVGGGITGLTTAILLQAHDYRTSLYTDARPSQTNMAHDPAFATLHAVASVIPHSVRSRAATRWLSISQDFFRNLSVHTVCGVQLRPHYELFEAPAVVPPDYATTVENFALLSDADLSSGTVPRRPGATALGGWRFDAFFCDAPIYVGYLYALYEAIGGRIILHSQLPGSDLRAYLALDHTYYVNATGSAAQDFIRHTTAGAREAAVRDMPGTATDAGLTFEPVADPWPSKFIRGHYLLVNIRGLIDERGAPPISYNYTPTAEVYQTAVREPADLYGYARSDAWILGGSRQAGRLGEAGEWIGEETVGEEMVFARAGGGLLSIPAPIFEVNADLLASMTGGVGLRRACEKDQSIVTPGIGYRFVRDSPLDDVRLAASRLCVNGTGTTATKYVVHNYGHGGSGFALSWGCAVDVLRMLDALTVRGARGSKLEGSASASTRALLRDVTGNLDEGAVRLHL